MLEQDIAEFPVFFLASDSLALAWLAQGDPSRAALVLDETAQAFPARMNQELALAHSGGCDGPRCTGNSGVSRRPSRSRPAYERSSRTPIPITSSSAN